MFRIAQDPSSWSTVQYFTKITKMVNHFCNLCQLLCNAP